ncbi:hypothetical protein A0H81_03264 [Grifola frondosa]|uniref:Uncharacterized protein n=1 Tax=Grifola frondosa TaxID=5627 RepID=A0A1C7MJS6_GRIFR|nr:hypothetical protein A0H81_03264 [Grifola frondosa]
MSDNIESGTRRPSALEQGPRKKPRTSDPLVHHGRHFGRTIHAMCNVSALIVNCVLRLDEREPMELLSAEAARAAGLRAAIEPEEMSRVADFRGASSARSDDTKSLKGHILDWIGTPGEAFVPPIARNIKTNRGYHHEVTGSLLCPAGLNWADSNVKAQLRSGEMTVPGDQWPIFLYANNQYDPDDPWNGLLRSRLLVTAYKHIFTSPSSVDDETKATRAGNARIHGMTKVTAASIAYIATQVRFALSSSSVFSRTDTVTDSERFYNSVLEFLDDINEKEDVDALLAWWNRHIFPGSATGARAPAKNSALAKLLERRKQKNNTAAAVST